MWKEESKNYSLTSSLRCLPEILQPHFFHSSLQPSLPALPWGPGVSGIEGWKAGWLQRLPASFSFWGQDALGQSVPSGRQTSPLPPSARPSLLFAACLSRTRKLSCLFPWNDASFPAVRGNLLLWVKEKLSWAREGSQVSASNYTEKEAASSKDIRKPASVPEVQNVYPHITLTRYKGDKVTHIFQIKKSGPSKGEQIQGIIDTNGRIQASSIITNL